MVLQAKIINSTATLNSYTITNGQEFIPGGAFTLAFVLWNPETKIRYIPVATAVVKLKLPNVDGTLEKTASFIDQDDRSLMKVEITAEESEDLAGGNFLFEVDLLGDGTQIIMGYSSQGLSRVTAGQGCC